VIHGLFLLLLDPIHEQIEDRSDGLTDEVGRDDHARPEFSFLARVEFHVVEVFQDRILDELLDRREVLLEVGDVSHDTVIFTTFELGQFGNGLVFLGLGFVLILRWFIG